MMRDLTQKEIDQAPDWAQRYFSEGITALYININDGIIAHINAPEVTFAPWNELEYALENSQPIPRKEFAISEYQFSDTDIKSVEIDGYADNEYLHFYLHDTNELTHSKSDVITMAKALKLTASDLS